MTELSYYEQTLLLAVMEVDAAFRRCDEFGSQDGKANAATELINLIKTYRIGMPYNSREIYNFCLRGWATVAEWNLWIEKYQWQLSPVDRAIASRARIVRERLPADSPGRASCTAILDGLASRSLSGRFARTKLDDLEKKLGQ